MEDSVDCESPEVFEKKCHAFLAHVVERKPKEKRIQDVPVVSEYVEVFPNELPGLPPIR